MRKYNLAWLIMLLFTLTFIPACGGGGGGDGGGGDISPSAIPLILGSPSENNLLLPGKTDAYKFNAIADQIYRIEIFGTRHDQAGWDGANTIAVPIANIPHIQLIDVDGATILLEHDYSGNINTESYWDWGFHDLDIPAFYATRSGTFFIKITQEYPAEPGGRYAIRVSNITPANIVLEQSPNEDISTAQLIESGDTVYGDYVRGESDFYKINTSTDSITCFEMTAYRNGIAKGDTEYFDPTLSLYDASGNKLTNANGISDLDIDDYFFYDPALCYKLSPIGSTNYYIEVVEALPESGGGDYFLTYISLTPNYAEQETTTENDNSVNAEQLDFSTANIVAGNVGTGLDAVDWYKFNSIPGDIVRVKVFDNFNSELPSATNSASVKVELWTPSEGTQLRADAPVESPVDSKTYINDGPGDFTIRTIIAPFETSSLEGEYLIKIEPIVASTPSEYTFILERFRSASNSPTAPPTQSNETLEMEPNNVPDPNGNYLDSNGFAAGDMDSIADIDYFTFQAIAGQFVTVNVYAKKPENNGANSGDKVHDLSGHGSLLEPVVRVFQSPNLVPNADEIVLSAFDPAFFGVTTEGLATAEGITGILPSMTATFVAPSTNIYYIAIQSGETLTTPFPTPNPYYYFIEVIK